MIRNLIRTPRVTPSTRTLLGTGLMTTVMVCGAGLILFPGIASAAFPGADGSIVFQSTRSGISPCNPYTSSELFSIAPTGGSSSQVDCDGHTDQHAFVSPDGTELVFASDRSGGSGAFQLYTESLTSPGPAVDVSYPPGVGVDDYPSWAPALPGHQDKIIFQRTLPGGSPQLYTESVSTPSSPAVPVFSSTTGYSDTEPVYDPSNANLIAFVRQAAGGSHQIYMYDLSTPGAAPVDISADDGDGSSNDAKPDFAPTLSGSPGVQEIVFQSDRSTAGASGGPCVGTQLYTMTDEPGSAIIPVFQVLQGSPPVPTGQQACPEVRGTKVATENPVFSPEGDAIAYDEPGDASQDIYAFEISVSDDIGSTTSPTDLTSNFATDEAPNWAPVLLGAEAPEVPQSMLLPVAGVGVFGVAGLFSLRRRRRPAGRATTSSGPS
jgi:MYXO-CTERM domain-containing protein